jgi:hypothetical protein
VEDLDFENYTLEKERETEIRSHLDEIKTKDWLGDLLILLQECGETLVIQAADELPGLGGKAITSKVFELGLLAEQCDVQIELSANELFVRASGKSLLEISFLPKNNEFVLLFWNSSQGPLIETLKEVLAPAIKRARSRKSERQKAFQERFKSA